ncbi:MAG: LamG-like jellyroll fold domain-containing protein [Phycisphaerales bacterium]
MLGRLNRLILCLGMLCLAARAADAALVGHWPFDGNLNDVVGTAPGTFNGGGATYERGRVRQAVSFDGVDDYVSIPSPTNPSVYTIAAWVKPARASAAAVITRTNASGPTATWSHQLRINATGQFHHYLYVGAERHVSGTTIIVPDTWYHVVIVAQNDGPMHLYVNGLEEGTSISTAGTLWAAGDRIHVGSNSGHGMGWFQGLVDDLQIYDEALADAQIREIMKELLAHDPIPGDLAVDVPCDAVAQWTASEFAAAHDVYFGAVFDDVNDASRDNPMGVLASQSQTATEFDPAVIEYGRTYYWRIDEVNAAPDYTIFKGDTWSFTAEPYAYPITSLTVEASAEQITSPAIRTIDGSGLDEFDQHGADLKTMWVTPGGLPAWIQYSFDKAYKLHELWVWNANSELELLMGFGAKDVVIEYSTDGETWTPLESVPEFAKGAGMATYMANTIVDLGEVTARHVRLTINDNWGATAMVSLSEVRFFYVPVQGFEPAPADGTTGVDLGATLNWRPGREATSHEVLFGTDANAVAEGAVAVEIVTDHSYTPPTMDLATTYYWKVNEVGDTGTYEGDLWAYTTQEFLVVDDFESYTDDMDAEETIWHAWIDGLTDSASGSIVGWDQSPFAERTIVRGGKQSMPLRYDNTTFTFSEAKRSFDPAQDWTARGVKALSLLFAGASGNGGQLYVKINNTKVVYKGDAGDLARTGWQAWNIDLSTVGGVSSVRSLTIGVEGSGVTGTLYVDDIRLYPRAPEYITPTDPGDEGLVAYYAFDGNTKDDSGNGLNGTFTGGTPEWIAGRHGEAILFNGASGYVDLGADEAMNLTEAMTAACWLRDDGFTQGWQAIFTKGLGWRLQRNGIEATLEWTCPPSPYLFSRGTVDDGEWHHITGTYDDRRQALYINGVLDVEQSVSEPIAPTSYRVLIGSIDTLTARVWHGPIDEARLYRRALSEGEILWLADQTMPRHKPF